MRSQVISPADWSSLAGSCSVMLGDFGVRRVEIDLITQGASLLMFAPVEGDDGEVTKLLLWCGQGSARVVVVVDGECELLVDQPDGGFTAIRVPELRSVDAQWRRTPSFSELDPPKPFTVSPEVQAIMDRMNQNAVRREMLLLQALDKRQRQS